MLKKFYPDRYVSSTYRIDFQKLYNEGLRGIIFDIDNTLVEHGKEADARAIKLFRYLKDIGFKCCLISNNRPARVNMFNRQIGVFTLPNAKKPSQKGYLKAMDLMQTNLDNTIFIGDQLFTDIWGAKRVGMRNILVRPIDKHEEIQIILKRRLEWMVLKKYMKEKFKEKNH